MNPELEKLIDFALADGILSDKEKEILYKKAKETGVDIDEFELVLQSKLHQIQKLKKQVIKCPSCGEQIFGLTKVCPACGYIINDAHLNLNEAINILQNLIVKVKSIPDTTFIDRIKSALYIYISIGLFAVAIGDIVDKNFYEAIIYVAVIIGGNWIYKRYLKDKINPFPSLLAEAEKQKNLIKIYYAENQKVSIYLTELDFELTKVKNERNTKIRRTNIGCLTIIAIIIILYFVFFLGLMYFLKDK